MRRALLILVPFLITSCAASSNEGGKPSSNKTPGASAGLPFAIASNPQEGAKCFDKGVELYHEGNMADAVKQFIRAGQLGDLRGYTQTGWHYEKGAGVEQSWAGAAEYYRKGAEQGDPVGMKNIGQLYEFGRGVPEDWVAAAQWYRKSADKGYADGEAALARAYQFGIGVPQDRAAAIQWDKKALAHGDKESEHWIRFLKNPLNNIGFRNTDEQNMVMGSTLRTSGLLLGADPAGILFHSSTERVKWLSGLRNRVDSDEAQRAREREVESRQRHQNEVRRLEGEGYDHSEAERRAGW